MHIKQLKKYLISTGFAVAVFILVFSTSYEPKPASTSFDDPLSSSEIENVRVKEPVKEQSRGKNIIEVDTTPSPRISVDAALGSASARISIPEGSSVFDAMSALVQSDGASFKSRYFSSLGHFVEEIDGKKNGGGYYWTLYVNGKYSDSGASSAILSEGDSFEWRYENK